MCNCKTSHVGNKQPAKVKQVVKSVPLGRPATVSSEPKRQAATTPVTPVTHVARNIRRTRVIARRPI